jgi:hypothetical protein
MMDSSENDNPMETPTNPSDEPQAAREVDLPESGKPPPSEPSVPAENTEGQPFGTLIADPGIYVCKMENAGEHTILGRLDFGEEYDYSQEKNPDTLAAVATFVESGVLEKKA